jgi:hypothetical protein
MSIGFQKLQCAKEGEGGMMGVSIFLSSSMARPFISGVCLQVKILGLKVD